MGGINRNPRFHLLDIISEHDAGIQAIATQQYQVTSDPTGATGDPAHLHAVFVVGWLGTICGINRYGAASFRTGAWVQV